MKKNCRIPLAISDEQKQYVANSTTILARAHAYRNARSRAHILYNDETPVGMGLYRDEPELDAYIFSELFIDAQDQGKGYGTLDPSEYDTSPSPEYKELLQMISRNEEKLLSTMTDAQKALFERYADCVREFQAIAECLLFQNSFCLGARIMLEITGTDFGRQNSK